MNFKILLLTIFISTQVFAADILPPISLQNLSKETISSTEWKGKYVLIDIWATWCVSCRKMYPALNELQKAYPKKLQVVGISIDKAKKKKLKRFSKRFALNYTLLHDPENSMASVLGYSKVPTLYLYSPEGKLLLESEGGSLEEAQKLKDFVSKQIKK